MVKKIAFVLIAVVLISVLTLTFFLRVDEKEITKVLPKNPAAYYHIRDIDTTLEYISSSKLWENIKKIDVNLLLNESNAPQDMIEQYEKFKEVSENFIANVLAKEYFGQEALIAFYPPLTSYGPLDSNDLLSGLILVSRTTPQTKISDVFVRSSHIFNKELDIKTHEFQNHKITEVNIAEGVNLYYTRINDLVVLSPEEKRIHQAIETAAGERESLSQNSLHLETMAHLEPGADCYSYLEYSTFLQSLKAITAKLDTAGLALEDKNNFFDSFEINSRGFRSLAQSIKTGEVSESKSIILLDKEKLSPLNSLTYTGRPKRPESLQYISKDALYSNWLTFADLEITRDFLKELEKDISKRYDFNFKDGEIKKSIVSFGEEKGIDIGKLLPAFGNELLFALNTIKTGTMFSVPEAIIILGINEKEEVSNLIDILLLENLENIPFGIRTREFNNHKIKYVTLPFVMRPGYCLTDEYLFVATDYRLIEEAFENSKHKVFSIVTNPDLEKIGIDFEKASNSITIFQTKDFFNSLSDLIEESFAMFEMASQFQQQPADQSEKIDLMKIYLDEAILPLIDGLKEIETIASQTFIDEEKIVTHTYLSREMRR